MTLLASSRGLVAVSAAFVLAVAPTAAAAEDVPAWGDIDNGQRLYAMNCAACHGWEGRGDGPAATRLAGPAGDLRSGARMLRYDRKALSNLVAQGGRAGGEGSGSAAWMPAFGEILDTAEIADVIAYLARQAPDVRQVFPDATRYLIKEYEVTSHGLERVEKALKRTLPDAEKRAVVVTAFRGGAGGADEAPRIIPPTPNELAELKRSDKLGYLAFVPVHLPGGDTAELTVAVGNEIKVRRLIAGTVRGKGAPGGAWTAALPRFEGEHRRGSYALPSPKQVPPDVASAVGDALLRAAEAVYAYEAEEKERSWADEDF